MSVNDRQLAFWLFLLTPVLEALLVIILVAEVEMGALLKPSTAIGGVISPASLGIVVIWLVGLFLINRASKDPRWKVTMPGSSPGRRRHEREVERSHPFAASSTTRLRCLRARLARDVCAGVALEESGNSSRIGSASTA
jgi:cation:H+ antiporter